MVTREKKRSEKVRWYQGVLSHKSLGLAVAAVVDLYKEQKNQGINSNPHPALTDGIVRQLSKVRERNESKRIRQDFVDRDLGTDLEALGEAQHLACNVFCLNVLQNNSINALRDRLMLNLSTSCLLRGYTARNAELPDFHLITLPGEGTPEAFAVCMSIDIDKTIKDGAKHIMGAMRHKDFRLCVHNSLALHFFHRWYIIGEPFPQLDSKSVWYSIKIFTTRNKSQLDSRETPMTYRTHLNAIKSLFTSCHLRSRAKTHVGRSRELSVLSPTTSLKCRSEEQEGGTIV